MHTIFDLPPIPVTRVDLRWTPQGPCRGPILPGDAARRALDTAARALVEEWPTGDQLLAWWDPRTAQGNRPRPWTLRLGEWPGPEGEIGLRLHLFGEIPSLGFVHDLVTRAPRRGLAGTGGVGYRLTGLRVEGDGVCVNPGVEADWPAPRPLATWVEAPPSDEVLRIELLTPLQRKAPVEPLDPAGLFHLGLERLRALCRLAGLHDAVRWEAPADGLPLRARLVGRGHPAQLAWTHAGLGGLVGDLQVPASGDLPALLSALEVTQAGRHLTSGLGCLRLVREARRGSTTDAAEQADGRAPSTPVRTGDEGA